MYRLKEALIAFWVVLTHKYYVFASVSSDHRKYKSSFYCSKPAEKNPVFWTVIKDFIIQGFKNGKG